MIDEINDVNKMNENCFGYSLLMVNSSRCRLGAMNDQSFAERINSAANIIIKIDRLKMDPHL